MRVTKENAIALVIDVQEKLFPHMFENESLLFRNETLIKGLQLLSVPIIVSEQYPKGLGKTLFDIQKLTSEEQKFEKLTFSCIQDLAIKDAIQNSEKKFVIISGIEAHVCVLQTVLDLIEMGLTPVVIEDCISSRKNSDKEIAINRMLQAGAIVSSYESILFELCLTCENPVFKEISALVK